MALPASGPLSLNDIQVEFGGANPIGINEYYGVAAGIPASGTIAIDDFYGASAIPVVTYIGGATTGAFRTGSTFQISSVNLGPSGSKRVLMCVHLVDTNGALTTLNSITFNTDGVTATLIAKYERTDLDLIAWFEVTTTATLGTFTFNMASYQTYLAGMMVFNLSPTATLVGQGAMNRLTTYTVSYPASSLIIAAAGAINTSIVTWTGLTSIANYDYYTNEWIGAGSRSNTTAGSVNISYSQTQSNSYSNEGYYLVYA